MTFVPPVPISGSKDHVDATLVASFAICSLDSMARRELGPGRITMLRVDCWQFEELADSRANTRTAWRLRGAIGLEPLMAALVASTDESNTSGGIADERVRWNSA